MHKSFALHNSRNGELNKLQETQFSTQAWLVIGTTKWPKSGLFHMMWYFKLLSSLLHSSPWLYRIFLGFYNCFFKPKPRPNWGPIKVYMYLYKILKKYKEKYNYIIFTRLRRKKKMLMFLLFKC